MVAKERTYLIVLLLGRSGERGERERERSRKGTGVLIFPSKV
jgi:hypothetical protein